VNYKQKLWIFFWIGMIAVGYAALLTIMGTASGVTTSWQSRFLAVILAEIIIGVAFGIFVFLLWFVPAVYRYLEE